MNHVPLGVADFEELDVAPVLNRPHKHTTLAALYVLGELVSPLGLGPVTDIAIKVYQAFFGEHIRKSAMPSFYPD